MPKVTPKYNLNVLYPKVAKEWHPTKNKPLTPKNITSGNKKKVWWKCSKNHEYFGLIVKGESMIEEGIMDGDIAILKHSKSVNNGKIAAVLIKGEDVTLKKLKLHDTTVKLIPANPSYKEKTYSAAEIEVQGELKGLIRKYN